MFKMSLVTFFPVLLVFFGFRMVSTNELILTSKHDFVLTPCENESDCEHIENGTCVNDVCMCNGSKVCLDKKRNERIVTEIGKPCEHDTDCNIEHSECSEGKVCVCKTGRVKSTDARKCLVISDGIEGNCEDSVQCYTKIPNSSCHYNRCVCQQHMHHYNGTCFNSVELHKSCEKTPECYTTKFTECVNSQCQCQNGFVANSVNTTCLPVVTTLGSACFEDAQCRVKFGGAALCRNSFCGCRDLYQLKESNQKCVREMLLGETCIKHAECHGPEAGPRRLECILGECKCKSYYIEEHGYCIEKSPGDKANILTTLNILALLLFKIF